MTVRALDRFGGMKMQYYWWSSFAWIWLTVLFPAPVLPAEPEQGMMVDILPAGDLFQRLIADPKQPQFGMSILHASIPARDTTAWTVSFGETFGIVRWTRGDLYRELQLNLAGAVFAQFDLGAPSSDLINADYVIGFPLTMALDRWSGRFRIYHQSSHLGDEFLLRVQPARVNLSFESAEFLLSYERGPVRVYGGGEYLFRREPSSLHPGMIHGGLEYRHSQAFMRVKGLGYARPVGALDIKSWEEDDWSPAFSTKAGIEFGPAEEAPNSDRHWSLLVEWYKGFTPYGQFFKEDVSYLGFGIQLSL